jgi:elongation factor P
MQATALRKGTKILFRNELYTVTEFSHHTPGNKRAFVQATLKNLKSGKMLQNRFSSTDDVERVVLDSKTCQFLYHDEQGFHFMEMESYENFMLGGGVVGDNKYFLKENAELKIEFYDGRPVLPVLPKVVMLKVTESPPWVKGDSVSNNMKPGVCETGLKLQIPIFIEECTEIKVNTDTGEYIGRA